MQIFSFLLLRWNTIWETRNPNYIELQCFRLIDPTWKQRVQFRRKRASKMLVAFHFCWCEFRKVRGNGNRSEFLKENLSIHGCVMKWWYFEEHFNGNSVTKATRGWLEKDEKCREVIRSRWIVRNVCQLLNWIFFPF